MSQHCTFHIVSIINNCEQMKKTHWFIEKKIHFLALSQGILTQRSSVVSYSGQE